MHTPEPRSRHSGGEAQSVTPQVDSNNVTPIPRAGFLRRGDGPTLHGALAAGPSVLFDEESGTAVALDVSPQPTQLTQQLQSSQILSDQGGRLPRQRPRFHTVQDLDVALNQAIEGKITSRNAWASKEASDLLEGITHTIETTLDAASADDYAGFAKAATVVEGCSKVWTSRVDSTYLQSNQMVQRLLRKDESAANKGPGVGEREGGEGQEDGDDAQQQQQSQRAKGRARGNANARTLAMDATEINLDSKGRTALTQTGINAQFRAITSKFDQGNAQGLLMNNAPIGRAGNIILDVDYSLMPASAGRSSGGGGGRSRRVSGHAEPAVTSALQHQEGEAVPAINTDEAQADTVPDASRISQHAGVEHDAAVYETVADLPPYFGISVAPLSGSAVGSPTAATAIGGLPLPLSARASLALSQNGSRGVAGEARASQTIDPLLLLPHATSSSASNPRLDEPQRMSALKADEGPVGDGMFRKTGGATADVARASGSDGQLLGDNFDNTNDYGDWGGGGDDGDDDGDDDMMGDDSETFTGRGSAGMTDDGLGSAGDVAAGGVSARDLGLEARNLVSGITEMNAMDTLFHGHTQLALEAEDPTSWCPLSEVAKNPLAGGLGRSELSRLHREHRFTQSQRPFGASPSQDGTGGSGVGPDPHSPLSPGGKRARKERTVVFQLPDPIKAAASHGAASPVLSLTTFLTKAELQSDPALRQATTAGRNMTPLGKQLLIAKDAAHAVLAYTQSAVQRAKAEQIGLVLREPPLPGKTIPSYMPYPVHTQDFFQPFSTALTQWNLLRKSATGRLIDSGDSGAVEEAVPLGRTRTTTTTTTNATGTTLTSTGGDYTMDDNGAGGSEVDSDGFGAGTRRREADMPVEFFPGGAEVEGVDGAEAGGDYADYADLYGPDENDGDSAAEHQYVQEGFRASADARLVAQVELAAAAAATSSGGASPASSTRNSAGGPEGNAADPMELLKVLSSPEATIPNQVDVVQLRQLMWDALQGHLSANRQDQAADLTTLRGDTGTLHASADATAGKGQSLTAKTAVKTHAQAALNRLRKRARTVLDDSDSENDAEAEGKEKTKDTSEEAPKVQKPLNRADDPFLQLTGAAAAAKSDGPVDIPLTKFSDVVRTVLPHISAVSSTNTLSPAFFFFSILFLANEHNVVLRSVDALNDLHACGIACRVGEH